MNRAKLHYILQVRSNSFIHRGKIKFLFLNEKQKFMKHSILLVLPAAYLQCWENFNIKSNRNTKFYGTFYAFKPYSAHFVSIFLVSCFHLKNMAFVEFKIFIEFKAFLTLCKSFCRLCLLLSAITDFSIFVSSTSFAMKL